ncbi:hypothetical protein K456DRAFT_313862 [Colletotrichum gloeosporioides 23]|nr:hypothetical protein K456DRAFT_313862 [Colletotrichum gloeosporioides 23]
MMGQDRPDCGGSLYNTPRRRHTPSPCCASSCPSPHMPRGALSSPSLSSIYLVPPPHHHHLHHPHGPGRHTWTTYLTPPPLPMSSSAALTAWGLRPRITLWGRMTMSPVDNHFGRAAAHRWNTIG